MGKKYPLDGVSIKRHDHITMMRSPEDWPVLTALPLKRRVANRNELGIYLGPGPDGTQTVYLCSMFETITEETPRETYASHDEVVDAGWKVD